MDIHIVGEKGLFGSFLKELLDGHVTWDESAENIILSVPFHAYEEVAEKYKGKHLINVCSVQEDTNAICLRYSDHVTGIHPMFGPKSPNEDRNALLTYRSEATDALLDLLIQRGVNIRETLPDGRTIDGALHDQMMALVHTSMMHVVKELAPVVKEASWIPEYCMPTSFKRAKSIIKQWEDMGPGTLDSLRANKYGKKI